MICFKTLQIAGALVVTAALFSAASSVAADCAECQLLNRNPVIQASETDASRGFSPNSVPMPRMIFPSLAGPAVPAGATVWENGFSLLSAWEALGLGPQPAFDPAFRFDGQIKFDVNARAANVP